MHVQVFHGYLQSNKKKGNHINNNPQMPLITRKATTKPLGNSYLHHKGNHKTSLKYHSSPQMQPQNLLETPIFSWSVYQCFAHTKRKLESKQLSWLTANQQVAHHRMLTSRQHTTEFIQYIDINKSKTIEQPESEM